VAGLGVGGLAVALAAQKSLENLFGGLTLIVDQPVHVGDFCRFGDRVGTVEDIGLRSTRIRTLDRTLVTIPNSEFSSMQIENFARRDRIWLATTIGVRYETTPDQLRFLLISLKRMLLAHPMIDPDPARVRFSGFGASSLDIDIFAYVRTTDINEFYAVREDVFLRLMEVVVDSGTGFAFPSQTIYAAADTGVDTERGSAAAAQVAQWRGAGELSMPTPSPRVVDEIADTLDYPPKGSASSG
jgi:MscS family membrane protein